MRNKENLILVTGATCNVGRQLVSQLIGAGAPPSRPEGAVSPPPARAFRSSASLPRTGIWEASSRILIIVGKLEVLPSARVDLGIIFSYQL